MKQCPYVLEFNDSQFSVTLPSTYFQVTLLLKVLDPSPPTARAVNLKDQEQ